MIRIEEIENIEAMAALEEPWQDLWQRMGEEATVFSSFPWYRLWWTHFGGGRSLGIVAAWEGDTLVGLAPLMRERCRWRGVPVRIVRFIENGNSLHNDFLVDPSRRAPVVAALFDSLARSHRDWDVIELKNLPEDSPNRAPLSDVLRSGPHSFRTREGLKSPYIPISCGWEPFFGERSGRTRKTLRNIRNRFEKAGSWELRHLRTFEEYEKHFQDILTVARASWTQQAGDSLGSERNREFFLDLARAAGERGWLSVWLLYLEGKPTAFEYHLNCRGRIHGLRASYDEGCASLSPGAFLDYQIMRNLFEGEGKIWREYDLGGSSDEYKRKWADRARGHDIVHIFKKTAFSRALLGLEYALVPFARKFIGKKKP